MRCAVIPLLAAMFWGCSSASQGSDPKIHRPNPFPELRTVAVLPFINQTRNAEFDGVDMANIMATELAKFGGFRTIRPQQAPEAFAGERGPATIEEALQVGRRVQADAVMVVSVTDYDPYVPPRMSVSVQVFRVAGRRLGPGDVDRLVQSASWRSGPMPVARERAGHWVAAFEDVYDAREARTRSLLLPYARAQEGGDTAFTGDREFIAVQSRFVQFVCNRVIHQVIAAAELPNDR